MVIARAAVARSLGGYLPAGSFLIPIAQELGAQLKACFLWVEAKHATAMELPAEQFVIAGRAAVLVPRLYGLIEELGGSLAKEDMPPFRERLSMRTDLWVRIPLRSVGAAEGRV